MIFMLTKLKTLNLWIIITKSREHLQLNHIKLPLNILLLISYKMALNWYKYIYYNLMIFLNLMNEL